MAVVIGTNFATLLVTDFYSQPEMQLCFDLLELITPDLKYVEICKNK